MNTEENSSTEKMDHLSNAKQPLMKLIANQNFTLEDKPFWAAFTNLGHHNVFLTLSYINKRLGLNDMIDEDEISKWLGFKKPKNEVSSAKTGYYEIEDLETKARLSDMLLKHFPFLLAVTYQNEVNKQKKGKEEDRDASSLEQQGLKRLSDPFSLESILDMLRTLVELLYNSRNYYSHHCHHDSPTLPPFGPSIKMLYAIFDESVRMVKGDYKHNSEIDPHKDFFHLIRATKSKEKEPKIIANTAFSYPFSPKETATANGPQPYDITLPGFVFFVSLFLEKKDAIWMQKKINGLKDDRKNLQRMTNEVFCRNHIILPKQRLETTFNKDWMLLDMLNELMRCPKNLYDRLSPKEQDKFRVPFETFEEEAEDNDEILNPFKNLMVRNPDRFPYFALRYFDLQEAFSELRFQVDLGTYHFAIYDKQIGGDTMARHLTRTMFGFARIQQFTDEERSRAWGEKVKDTDELYQDQESQAPLTPYVTKTNPHYHLEHEKIGIKFTSSDNSNIYPSLEITSSVNGRTKFTLGTGYTADAFLSVHELLPMMFCYLLYKSDEKSPKASRKQEKAVAGNQDETVSPGKKIQKIIETTRDNIFAIYDKFADGTIDSIKELEAELLERHIEPGHMPHQMYDILNGDDGDSHMEEDAKRKISEMITDTERRLEALHRQATGKIRIGKKKAGLPQVGKIAEWLVRDMMRFQPVAKDRNGEKLNNSKANSTEYRSLQRTLALYGSEQYRLPRLFTQMHLTGNENPHPFLRKMDIEGCTNILQFYLEYLTKRKEYLSKLDTKKWPLYLHFLKLKVIKTNRKTLVEGWKNGFNLPRGIFTESIREWMVEHYKHKLDITQKVKQLKRVGFTIQALRIYFENDLDDNLQSYYHLPFQVTTKDAKAPYLDKERRDKEWKKYVDKFKDIHLNKAEYKDMRGVDEQQANEFGIFKEWKKFQRDITLVQNQDRATWMMCMDLLEEVMQGKLLPDKPKLREFDPDVAKEGRINILNEVKPMKVSIMVKLKYDDKGKNRSFRVQLREDATKLLKHGNMNYLARDRRLNGLLSFVKEPASTTIEIEKTRVEYELDRYQHARIHVFEMTLGLEKKIIDIDKTLNNGNFRETINNWRVEYGDDSLKSQTGFVIEMRNAFSHNQCPSITRLPNAPIEMYDPQNPPEKGMGIIDQLVAHLESNISQINQYIQDHQKRSSQ